MRTSDNPLSTLSFVSCFHDDRDAIHHARELKTKRMKRMKKSMKIGVQEDRIDSCKEFCQSRCAILHQRRRNGDCQTFHDDHR